MANPSRNDKPHADWANRLMFAHDNAVENLSIFAPLVLILNAIDYSSQWTVLACAVYFWARVAHLIVYTLGLPVFRTLAFTVGFVAQAVLALAIFRIVLSRIRLVVIRALRTVTMQHGRRRVVETLDLAGVDRR